MKTNEKLLSELQPARLALEAWRQSRRHREPIPQAIWDQVLPLARAHGLNPVASALRLNYYSLKQRLGVAAPKTARRGSAAALPLVELKGSAWGPACLVELEDRTGRKMKLQLGHAASLDTVGLVEAFWKLRLRSANPHRQRSGR